MLQHVLQQQTEGFGREGGDGVRAEKTSLAFPCMSYSRNAQIRGGLSHFLGMALQTQQGNQAHQSS